MSRQNGVTFWLTPYIIHNTTQHGKIKFNRKKTPFYAMTGAQTCHEDVFLSTQTRKAMVFMTHTYDSGNKNWV